MSKIQVEYGGNMVITTSNWGPHKTFKLMPLTIDCPYVEAIFDPSSKILAIISKIAKSSYHMIAKLDDNGDEVKLKISKRQNGKEIKEQRVLMDTHAEYYITDINEAKELPKPEISKMEFDMKDKMVRDAVLNTEKNVEKLEERMIRMEDKMDQLILR